MPIDSPDAPAARVLNFTTQGIAPSHRVRVWEEHNARVLMSLDIRTIDESPLSAAETTLHLPSLRLAQVQGTPQIVERSESFIRGHPMGAVAVFFAMEGDSFLYHHGGMITLRPGQAVVQRMDRPFVRGFSQGFRELVLTIPQEVYQKITGTTGPDRPTVFDFGAGADSTERALARLVHGALGTIRRADSRADRPGAPGPGPTLRTAELREIDPSVTERDALGLLHLVLAAPGGNTEGYVAASKDFIERHLEDPGLTTVDIASAIGISERQLGRIFAESGTTVGRYVLARRLDRARNALASPSLGRLTVGEVAARFGFIAQSHFGRAFRNRFGMTPLQWRKQARSELVKSAAPAPGAAKTTDLHRVSTRNGPLETHFGPRATMT